MRCPHCGKQITKAQIAKHLGSQGGKAWAKSLTPEQRSEAARKAVQSRWAKKKSRQSD